MKVSLSSTAEYSSKAAESIKDLKPNALKIGMLQSEKVIFSVLKTLKKIKTKKIILDPVMVSKGGVKLINDSAIRYLKKRLIKKVYIILSLIHI